MWRVRRAAGRPVQVRYSGTVKVDDGCPESVTFLLPDDLTAEEMGDEGRR